MTQNKMTFRGMDTGAYAFSGLLDENVNLADGYCALEERVRQCESKGASIPHWGYVFHASGAMPHERPTGEESLIDRVYQFLFKGPDFQTAKKYFLEISKDLLIRTEYVPVEKIGPRS